MILIRLPWRHRARPSATLHEIHVSSEERRYPSDPIKEYEIRQWQLLGNTPTLICPEMVRLVGLFGFRNKKNIFARI
jgi:hypothetical protein